MISPQLSDYELQSLPSLTGYLAIADGSPPAQVELTPRNYPKAAERLVKRKVIESVAHTAQLKMNLPFVLSLVKFQPTGF